MSLPNTLQRLPSVEHGEEQTQTGFTKNLAGKSFIVGDGIDVHVTFINCKATKDHCTYATKYYMNVLSVTIYQDQTRLNHLPKAPTNLLILISKIVLENEANQTNLLETVQRFLGSNCNLCVLSGQRKHLSSVFMTLREYDCYSVCESNLVIFVKLDLDTGFTAPIRCVSA